MAKKPEPKTRPTDVDPMDFLSELQDEKRKQDAIELLEMMRTVSKMKAVMWGNAIIGFGSKPIKYANGSELDWPMMAFSPRKASLTLYLNDFPEFEEILRDLGPSSRSKGCLYIKSLAVVDKKALKLLLTESLKAAKNS